MPKQLRARALARVMVFVLCAVGVPAVATAQSGQFAATGSMGTPRQRHSATQLRNGKVLIAAGYPYNQTAELYDPTSGTFAPTGSMSVAGGADHTATLLPSGKVLVAGGWGVYGGTAGAELYDPATGTFTVTGVMSMVRRGHTATLLPNGKVLVAGGGTWLGSSWEALNTAELYDPATGTFTPTVALTAGRFRHSAILLPSGKVLLAGGTSQVGHYLNAPWVSVASAEVYDPTTGTFTSTGSMSVARNTFTLTALGNGRLLVVGGNVEDGVNGIPLTSAEVFDTGSGVFTPTGQLLTGRDSHTATLLPTGKVLVAGGRVLYSRYTQTVEVYDPTSGAFSAVPSMSLPRTWFTATLLASDGRVLIAGGSPGPDQATPMAELYGNPSTCY
jgi:Kelch motif protein/galactose oxidase-like protein